MPAINPARLKKQTATLVEGISDPKAFISELQGIFDFYADRTKHPGRGEKQVSLLRSYNVPKQVLRQIKVSLRPVVIQNSENILALSDLLWDQNWVEFRILALDVLGWATNLSQGKIADMLDRRVPECVRDSRLTESLADLLLVIWQNQPEFVLNLITTWLASSNERAQKIGLLVVPYFVRSQVFNNLPAIYKMIRPYMQTERSRSSIEFIEILRSLAGCSPQETAYFLKQYILITDDPRPEILIRQCIDFFPEYDQIQLREFLHKRRNEYREM